MRERALKFRDCLYSRAVLVFLLACLPAADAQDDKKDDAPRITAVAPMEVVPGTTVTLRIRGSKLDEATEVRFPKSSAPLTASIKEKKKADVPTGQEAKVAGDTLVEASVVVPSDLAAGTLAVEVVTPKGTSLTRDLCVVAADTVVPEKEPNSGFRTAQPIEPGTLLCGSAKEDKDVDVYRLSVVDKMSYVAEVVARRYTSLLDAAITIFDSQGNVVAVGDDDGETRDARVTFTAPAGVFCYISVQDASDHGGAWSNYQLTVKEAQ